MTDLELSEALAQRLVGYSEIAERAHVAGRETVRIWRMRHNDFPPPMVTLAMGPIFDWREVHAWLVATGRLP